MITDYAGAVGRCPIESITAVGNGYMIQPKIDGTYARVHLDGKGRIARMFSRRGELGAYSPPCLMGQVVGAPHAQLIGEVELWTESANRLAATRGYRMVHLFDCLHDGQRYLAREPYSVRRDALHRMQAALETGPLPWRRDTSGNAHSRATGKFCPATPTDWRLAPIVPQLPLSRFDQAWREWVELPCGEGLVLVNQQARVGSRRAKLKVKLVDTLDAVVVGEDKRRLYCSFSGHTFAVARGKHQAGVGACLEIQHNGFYESATIPKFPRVVRVRGDKLALR